MSSSARQSQTNFFSLTLFILGMGIASHPPPPPAQMKISRVAEIFVFSSPTKIWRKKRRKRDVKNGVKRDVNFDVKNGAAQPMTYFPKDQIFKTDLNMKGYLMDTQHVN